MVWVTAAIAAASAAVSIVGGISSSNAAEAEAERAEQYAAYNAAQQQAWGREQAQFTMMSAMYNAQSARAQTEFNIGQSQSLIDYNVGAAQAATAYNSLLYDDQVSQIMEAADFDLYTVKKQFASDRGSMIANMAASGTTIGFGSNKDAVIESMADEAFVSTVIDRNMVNSTNSILNAKALGQWQSDMAVQKMQYEGQLSIASMRYNTDQSVNASLIGAAMSAYQTTRGADNQATGTLLTGQQQSGQLESQASMYLVQGLSQGAQYATRAYGAYSAGATPTANAESSLLAESSLADDNVSMVYNAPNYNDGAIA